MFSRLGIIGSEIPLTPTGYLFEIAKKKSEDCEYLRVYQVTKPEILRLSGYGRINHLDDFIIEEGETLVDAIKRVRELLIGRGR